VVLVHGSDPLTNGGTSFGHLRDGGRSEVLVVNVWLNLGDDLCVCVFVCVCGRCMCWGVCGCLCVGVAGGCGGGCVCVWVRGGGGVWGCVGGGVGVCV